MSQPLLARSGPLSAPEVTPPRRLWIVPSAPPTHRVFVGLCLALLAAGLVSLLLLNTALVGGSFRLHTLQESSDELAAVEEELTQSITTVSSPAALALAATRLGMVPTESVAFIRLSDGKILGTAAPAKGTTPFEVVVRPPVARTNRTTKPKTPPPPQQWSPRDGIPHGQTVGALPARPADSTPAE